MAIGSRKLNSMRGGGRRYEFVNQRKFKFVIDNITFAKEIVPKEVISRWDDNANLI